MTDDEKRAYARAYRKTYYERNREQEKEKQRAYYYAHRDRAKEYASAYRKANPEKVARNERGYRLKRDFGISLEQFDTLLAAQNFSCAICRSTETGASGHSFHVDHCHTSGVVRGLLCHNCNVGLGHFRDNPASLERAIGYLAAQGNANAPPQAP